MHFQKFKSWFSSSASFIDLKFPAVSGKSDAPKSCEMKKVSGISYNLTSRAKSRASLSLLDFIDKLKNAFNMNNIYHYVKY